MNRIAQFGFPEFVAARLQGKFDLTPRSFGDDDWISLWRYRVTVMRGKKYHRIVIQSSLQEGEVNWDREQRSSHCFVDDEGNVYMAAGWKAPNKAVRYNVSTDAGAQEFIDNADPYGGYLYAHHKKVEAA